MKLSVIIVNYNVCYFLDQAIDSVLQSITDFDFEILVVDNGSVDGSIQMVRSKYPQVQLIETGSNLGFAKANNIAAQKCIGEFLLLLNPDTLLKADTLQKCVDFLKGKENAGALGVKMHDGSGKYLPESKRGFPGPWTAFFKITGFNNLFPRSRWFNYYYLGHLPSDRNQSVDVLTGAFMMLEREKYMELGGLDEDFFMYGEDIDLCYRLKEKGYKNFYLASSSIIHFKGESTSKRSVRYIKTFYKAMSIYARKHYGRRLYAVLSFFIQIAIYARALVAIMSQRLQNILPFLRDTLLISAIGGGLTMVLKYPLNSTELIFFSASIPVVWLILGLYRREFNWWAFIISCLLISMLLVPASILASSPMPIIVGVSALLFTLGRIIMMLLLGRSVFTPVRRDQRVAGVISNDEGFKSINKLMDFLQKAPIQSVQYAPSSISRWIRGEESTPDEIVFDPRVISWDQIVQAILKLSPDRDFRILSLDQQALITSRSKNETAAIITQHHAEQESIRQRLHLKQTSDRFYSVLVLLLSPVLLIWKGRRYVWNAYEVLRGRKTWIGVSKISTEWELNFPTAVYDYGEKMDDSQQRKMAQAIYVRTYHPLKDWSFLLGF